MGCFAPGMAVTKRIPHDTDRDSTSNNHHHRRRRRDDKHWLGGGDP